MNLPVLTAVTNASWEAELVAALDGSAYGLTVVRRCVDVADLLATAAAGTARAVVLSADLRRLDREVLSRLQTARVAVVGLVESGDENAERHLRQLGVEHVLPANAEAATVAAVVAHAVSQGQLAARSHTYADPRAALPPLAPVPMEMIFAADPAPAHGQVVAVWGPTGAPGRTTLAVGLADEAARLGLSTLLIDADTYGGVIAQVLGLLDEAPGLAAATHLDNTGGLTMPALSGLARTIHPQLRVLTGITRADRWVEIRPDSVLAVLKRARSMAMLTVVDCGFCLETDEELSYDTAAPRRNGVTVSVLEAADVVLAIGAADPIGISRLIRGLDELSDVIPGVSPRIVVNKLRRGLTPGDPVQDVAQALQRFAGISQVELLPYDQLALDQANAFGKTLAEAQPDSPLRIRLAQVAESLIGAQAFARSQYHQN